MTADVMNPSNDRQSYNISVVIPAYNAEKYVGRAIDSVLAQTRPPDEIIVVDDGSTDNTAEVIRSYGSKVCFIHQENGGACVARNTGIEAATGQWIAFLDADDEWLPEKLAVQIEHLQRNPTLEWSASNYYIRTINDNDHDRIAVDENRCRKHLGNRELLADFFDAYVNDICVLTSTMIIKKCVFDRIGYFRVGQNWAEDTDLFWRIAYEILEVGYIAEPLVIYYYAMLNSLTRLNQGKITQRCDLIERHLSLAAEHGMSESFRPCALKLLTRWLREYLDLPNVDISQILDRFDGILPRNLKIEMRMRIASPRLAGCLFKCYFAAKELILPGKSRK